MNRQRGFAQGALIIGIALFALIAAALAVMARSDAPSISEQERKAAANVVIKRVAEIVQDHQVQAAVGDVKIGDGFGSLIASDVDRWPHSVFTGGVRGTTVQEGSVTYVTEVDEEFCKRLNEVLQIDGIPSTDDAPNDRIACVIAPSS